MAGLAALVAVVFLAAQGVALAHEIEHVLHLHDAPCALHVAADHLAMVSVPAPALAATPVPALRTEASPCPAPAALLGRTGAARAPLVPS